MRIVYFDGVCSLCNGFVDYLLPRNPELMFASLQSKTAAERLPRELTAELSTVVFADGGNISTHSEAAIRILATIYPSAKALLILPRVLRDFIYRLVARYRYAIFGKRETCRMPTPQERARFLD